jgi:hypothetical protein
MTRPLFGKSDQFHDLTNYIGKTAHLYHGAAALGSGFPVFSYPPPVPSSARCCSILSRAIRFGPTSFF